MITLTVNGKTRQVDAEPDTPLLWVVRDELELTGTKFGCGVAQCGACTVHVDGAATRSCSFPVSAAVGKKITTIEGLSKDASHPVQQAHRARALDLGEGRVGQGHAYSEAAGGAEHGGDGLAASGAATSGFQGLRIEMRVHRSTPSGRKPSARPPDGWPS